MTLQQYLTMVFCLCPLWIFAQFDVMVEASDTSGVAPFYVFFDATTTSGLVDTNALVNTDFTWNFDTNNTDPNGDWESTKGMVAGHVFEEAGSYTVSCTGTAPDGSSDTAYITITVTAFTGTTYYVSSLGDDSNDGLTTSTAWETGNFALSQLHPDEQILFHRGDTFPSVNYNLQNLTGGKMIIGAYGTGAKPILNGTLGQNILNLDFVDDLVITDLHCMVNANGAGAANFTIEDCTDILLHDLELQGSSSLAVYFDDCDKMAAFDCAIHNFGVLAVYSGDGTRLSWVGNTIDSLIGTPQPEHGIRIQGGEKQFIAHNTLTNLINTKSTLQIRGDNQQHVMIYQNKMDRILGVNPTNASTVQAISNVTIEGNYIGQNPDYTGTTWQNSINGINVEATNIAIRNNVIDGYTHAVNVSHDYNGVVSGWVDVYHNTVNWRGISPQSGVFGFITRVRDVSNVRVINNLITAPTIIEAGDVNYDGINTDIVVNNNIIATTSEYTNTPLPNSEADMNDISNYQIHSSSAAINAGVDTIPVFFDATTLFRNNGLPDVGAYEYQTILPVELLNFDATLLKNQQVQLVWSTAAETKHSHFIVQKSRNGFDWISIDSIDKFESTDQQNDYNAIDPHPYKGLSYYRLKQVDLDHRFTYSPVKQITILLEDIHLFPVPTNHLLHLRAPHAYPIDHIYIFNQSGAIVLKKLNLYASEYSMDVSKLSKGVYSIKIVSDNTIHFQQFIKH